MKKQILIIDDAEVNQILLGRMLESYEILNAYDDKQAAEMLEKHAASLSLIILDLVLPEANGLDILEQLKGNEATKDIPVIVMSAQVQMEQRVLEMGAVEFWKKPFYNAQEVQARVKKVLGD